MGAGDAGLRAREEEAEGRGGGPLEKGGEGGAGAAPRHVPQPQLAGTTTPGMPGPPARRLRLLTARLKRRDRSPSVTDNGVKPTIRGQLCRLRDHTGRKLGHPAAPSSREDVCGVSNLFTRAHTPPHSPKTSSRWTTLPSMSHSLSPSF